MTLPQDWNRKGGSPGLVVKGEDSNLKDVSSIPGTRYWMDIFSHTHEEIIMFFEMT